MKAPDPNNPGSAAFDSLDEKIRRALLDEGAIIPETIEEVKRAKTRLRVRPVTLPPHLRESSAIPEAEEDEVPIRRTVVSMPEKHECETVRRNPFRARDVFVEAVLISQFTRRASNSRFPLGHLRQTKFSYFAHRKAEEDVSEHYSKMPAGPYSPWAKYQGPEKIAQENGYVKRAKIGNLVGFVVGEKIDQIDQYLPRYPVCAAVDWVIENFLYEKKEELELLATVDFAALDVIGFGKAISLETIKNVIAANKEWAPKLDRAIFSDSNITRALAKLQSLFPATYA